MSGDHTETSLARIEAALLRLEAASLAPRQTAPASDPALALRHERLRAAAGQTLRQLDGLIGDLSR